MIILTNLDIAEQPVPANPPANEITFYVGTDGLLYAKDSNGTIYKIS